MKRIKNVCALVVMMGLFVSADAHKFYVGIHQVNYSKEKKMLQITSRIFVDDLEEALKLKHKREFMIGDNNATADELALMKKYLTDNFSIKVNGKLSPLNYLSSELEANVLICYFNIRDISKITSLEINNKILFDYVTEQQNIIQTNINGNKNSFLLTVDEPFAKVVF